MNTRLEALKAELALVKEANNAKYKVLMEEVNYVINKFMSVKGGTLIRSWASMTFRDSVEFAFEIGFKNEKNELDWGSEIDFHYDSEKKMLSVNHGCIGTFDKTNIYQFRRAALLSFVFDNIEFIEQEFENFVPAAQEALNRRDELKIEIEIRNIEGKQREEVKAKIEQSLTLNKKIMYSAECEVPQRHRLFCGVLTVTRTTPKYVFFYDEFEFLVKLKKEDVVNSIYTGNIIYA